MKLLPILAVFALMTSCQPGGGPKEPDPRPESQLAFISKLQSLYEFVNKGRNDMHTRELVDTAMTGITEFAKDSLDGSFAGWHAEVLDIKDKPFGLNVVVLELMVLKNLNDWTKKNVQYSSLILSDAISLDSPLIDSVRTLHKRSKVMISGKFNFNKSKLDIADYGVTLDDRRVFDNPKVGITLDNIATNQ